MTLYEISKEIENFEFKIDEETGEILNIMQLDEIMMARDEKIENIALYIKNLDAEATAIREEEKALAERRRSKEQKVESLKEYLSSNLDGITFETSKVKISFRKSQSLNVADVEKLPVEFRKVKIEADKTAIKNALKCGFYIEGCEIVVNSNIQIK